MRTRMHGLLRAAPVLATLLSGANVWGQAAESADPWAEAPSRPAEALAAPAASIAAARRQAPHLTMAVIAGSSIPIKGLNYYEGLGLRAGVLWEKLYLGGMLAVHRGDTKTGDYPAVPALSIPGGHQVYKSLPVFLAAD